MEEKFKNCVYCNKEFIYTNVRNIYCSDSCKAKHSRENKGILVDKECKNCKKYLNLLVKQRFIALINVKKNII